MQEKECPMSKLGEPRVKPARSVLMALAVCLLSAGLATSAQAQCPNYYKTILSISQVIVGGTAQVILLSGPRVEVTFTLQSQHAFRPPDPTGCDSRDGISLQTSSVNLSGFQTIYQDGSTNVVEMEPQNTQVDQIAFDFQLRYQESYNTTGVLHSKKKICELIIPWSTLTQDVPAYITPSCN
jgi:hypothetical protein